MTHVVWKYEIQRSLEFVIDDWPDGAEVLHVDVQGGKPCLWALIDPEAPAGPQRFLVLGTGSALHEENVQYCGTWFEQGGEVVWHLFRDLKWRIDT